MTYKQFTKWVLFSFCTGSFLIIFQNDFISTKYDMTMVRRITLQLNKQAKKLKRSIYNTCTLNNILSRPVLVYKSCNGRQIVASLKAYFRGIKCFYDLVMVHFESMQKRKSASRPSNVQSDGLPVPPAKSSKK